MHEAILKDYIKTELEKGRLIEQIEKELLGYKWDPNLIEKVKRSYNLFNLIELNRSKQESRKFKARNTVLLGIVIIILFVGSFFVASNFFENKYNPSPPTGLITSNIEYEKCVQECRASVQEKINNTEENKR